MFFPVIRPMLAGLALGLSAACTLPAPGAAPADGIFDPYETRNRATHARSKAVDRRVIRPVALAYADTVPQPVQEMVVHFADNLAVPGAVLNQLLQLDLGGALHNGVRFGLNSTLGFAGVFDVAAEFGIYEDEADFGQTLAVWGVPEGAYLELPILGPATERDAVGRVVDLLIDPLNTIARPESLYLKLPKVAAKVGKRGRYAASVDSLFYDSADSYAQSRLLYLQNRRFDVGVSDRAISSTADGEIDPYSELSGAMTDPYEELYGEQ
ncbi:VacJ family lipoprotein [Marinovum sp.]|uniref:MlaA family lipoprotein n=1 Tax=Marinovum sp. TaxID=2024839 RepID=UPI002B27747A|nr:VacJ family lipoprotein [Marinovum sp.]